MLSTGSLPLILSDRLARVALQHLSVTVSAGRRQVKEPAIRQRPASACSCDGVALRCCTLALGTVQVKGHTGLLAPVRMSLCRRG